MAVGLTLIFGVMRVVNFAHGDMMVWGMYLAYLLATRAGIDPYLSFVVCAAALFALGLLVQRSLVDRIIAAPHEMQILLMLGVALVLENLALVAFGPEPTRVRSSLGVPAPDRCRPDDPGRSRQHLRGARDRRRCAARLCGGVRRGRGLRGRRRRSGLPDPP